MQERENFTIEGHTPSMIPPGYYFKGERLLLEGLRPSKTPLINKLSFKIDYPTTYALYFS